MWIHEVDRQERLGEIQSFSLSFVFHTKESLCFSSGYAATCVLTDAWLFTRCGEEEMLSSAPEGPTDRELECERTQLQAHQAESITEPDLCWRGLSETRRSRGHCHLLFYTWPGRGKGRRMAQRVN